MSQTMVLSKKKREKVKKLLEEREKWEIIKAKTGVCFDTINRIRQEPSSSPTSTAPQVDKTPRVHQDQTKQIIDKVSTTDEDKQHPTTNTTPDPNYQRLEQMIKDSSHARQTQQQTTDLQIQNVTKIVNQLAQSKQTQEKKEPQPEKPDDPRDINELKYQEIKTKSLPTPTPKVQLPKKNQHQTDAPPQETQITLSPSRNPNDEQTLKTNLNQTVKSPENQENENQVISSYGNAVLFREAATLTSFLAKLSIDYSNYKKTGFFPSADYLAYRKKTNNEKKNKKPISNQTIIPSPRPCQLDPEKEKMYRERLAESQRRIEDSLRKTNERLKELNKNSSE